MKPRAKLDPCGQLGRKRHGVCGAAGWQPDQRQGRIWADLALADAECSSAVEGHRLQQRQLACKREEIARRNVPQCGIEAAGAVGPFHHIPQANPAGEQRRQPVFVAERSQVNAGNRRHQLPELVAWMRIILPMVQRPDTRKAAKHQQTAAHIDNGIKRFAGHANPMEPIKSPSLWPGQPGAMPCIEDHQR